MQAAPLSPCPLTRLPVSAPLVPALSLVLTRLAHACSVPHALSPAPPPRIVACACRDALAARLARPVAVAARQAAARADAARLACACAALRGAPPTPRGLSPPRCLWAPQTPLGNTSPVKGTADASRDRRGRKRERVGEVKQQQRSAHLLLMMASISSADLPLAHTMKMCPNRAS